MDETCVRPREIIKRLAQHTRFGSGIFEGGLGRYQGGTVVLATRGRFVWRNFGEASGTPLNAPTQNTRFRGDFLGAAGPFPGSGRNSATGSVRTTLWWRPLLNIITHACTKSPRFGSGFSWGRLGRYRGCRHLGPTGVGYGRHFVCPGESRSQSPRSHPLHTVLLVSGFSGGRLGPLRGVRCPSATAVVYATLCVRPRAPTLPLLPHNTSVWIGFFGGRLGRSGGYGRNRPNGVVWVEIWLRPSGTQK